MRIQPPPTKSQNYPLIRVMALIPGALSKQFFPLLTANQVTFQQWGTPSPRFETCPRDWSRSIYACASSWFNPPPLLHSISDRMKTPQLSSSASTKWSPQGPVPPPSSAPYRRGVWSLGGMPATSRDGLSTSPPFRYGAVKITPCHNLIHGWLCL